MSDLSDFMSNFRFDPSFHDSTLNSHSPTTDDACNIDNCLIYDCGYFDSANINSADCSNCELSLFHLNIRSLNKHANDVTNYVSTLDHHFDVYGFTETWFRSDADANLIDLDGYTVENCNRHDRAGGGASLFIDSKLQYQNRSDLKLDCIDCDSVFVEFRNQLENIVVGIIYKPEYVNFERFLSQLDIVVNTICKEKKRCYLMGDFNLDLLKYESRPQVNTFINLLYSNNFYPCIDRPTRIKPNKSNGLSVSLIDNIFTNDVTKTIKSGVIVTDLSDHFPVFTITNSNRRYPISSPSVIKNRQFKPANIQGFKNNISIVNWDFVRAETDPETAYTKFNDKLTDLLNIHCPIKETKISKHNTPKKPWVTRGIIQSIKTKDKLYKAYLSKPSIENKLKYTKYRNQLNLLLRVSKKSYILSEINDHKNNMKKTWQVLNNLLGRNKPTKLPDFFNDKQGNKITDTTEIANRFNEFFTNIGTSLASKIPAPDENYNPPPISCRNSNTMFLLPTTCEEIIKITNDLKSSFSAGVDEISTNLLKSIIPEINDILMHIFNCSLSTGIVPSKLKIAKVIPIYKADDKHSFGNYRPISVLPSISKILEKIIYNRIYKFVSDFNILSPRQFGFRPKRSTYMAINNLYSRITEHLDNKLYTVGIFLDLSKAFDTINHNILIHKLHNYGIRGLANNWISNYLSNRKQFVTYNHKSSAYTEVTCGVPQGSILGPLLFLLYINDLPLCSDKLHFILFADDTNILYSHKDPKCLEIELNKELIKISNWFKLNKLSLNIKKTNYMFFKNKHNNKPSINLKIIIDNNELTKVHNTKFLGVLIDDDLSWKSHTIHVSKIVAKYNGIIRKVRPFIPQESLVTLYNTLVLPYLTYCAIIWTDKNNSNLDSLFLVQKRLIRTCTNSLWLAHTDPLFKILNTLKIHDIYILQLASFMYQYHHDMLPPDLLDDNFFISNASIHNYNTRHTSDFHVKPTSTLLARNTIKTQGALLWNSLHSPIKMSPSLAVFKRSLKNQIVNQYSPGSP